MFNYRILSILFILTHSQLASATELADFYLEAIKSDPRLVSGKAEISIVKYQKRQALASLLPQISANSSFSKIDYKSGDSDSELFNGKRHSISLTQQLYNRNLWLDNKLFKGQLEQREEDFKDITSTVALDVTQRYLAVLGADNRLKLIKEQIKSTLIHINLVKTRYKKQLALKTEILDLDSHLQTLRVDEIDALNEGLIARESLTELVNREIVEKLPDFSEKLSYDNTMSSSDFVEHALQNSSMLRSIEIEVESSKIELSKQKSDHLPSLNFQLSAQESNIGFENSPSSDTRSVTASLNLNIPIYSGGSINARSREYRERIVVSEQRLERFKRELVKRVRESYFNTESSWKRIKANRQAIDAAIKSRQAVDRGFKFGTVTVVDVLNSLNRKFEAERDFKQSQYDFIFNYIQLLQLSGLLNDESIEKTRSWQKS